MDIRREVKAVTTELIRMRRYLHKHPEPSCEEKETAKFVADTLRGYGIPVKQRIGGGYGVVGLIKGGRPGRCLALRADMDALRIHEEAKVPYRSVRDGIMHACGHDAHMSILLVTANILNKYKKDLKGNVKLVFQPSEENHPGGAIQMVRAGCLENPKVDGILALHVVPNIAPGKIAVKSGVAMSEADEFKIIVKGKSGHGSRPDKTVDPVTTAAAVVEGLQKIVSRSVNPLRPAVITVSAIHGGQAYNIIPEAVEMIGTTRTFDKETNQVLRKEMKRVVSGICRSAGAQYEFKYMPGYPPLINDDRMCELVAEAGEEILGPRSVIIDKEPSMAAEDFTYYVQKVPGAMFRLGVKPKNYRPLHNAGFTIAEKALPAGVMVFLQAVTGFLSDGAAGAGKTS